MVKCTFYLLYLYIQSSIYIGRSTLYFCRPLLFLIFNEFLGSARTQLPTNINYAPELSTFGIIARVSQIEVQWKGLALGEPPSGSRLTPVPGKYACSSSILETPSKQIVHACGSSALLSRQVGKRESTPNSPTSHPVLSSHTEMKFYQKFVEFFSLGG